MKDEALKLALEALENNRRKHYYCEDTWYSCPKHEDGCANDAEGDKCNCGADKTNQQIDKAITAIKQALEAPVQEPVAWLCHPFGDDDVEYGPYEQCENCIPLYTTPPAQRQWVGLTDEDVDNFLKATWGRGVTAEDFIRAIEDKLKEKNT